MEWLGAIGLIVTGLGFVISGLATGNWEKVAEGIAMIVAGIGFFWHVKKA